MKEITDDVGSVFLQIPEEEYDKLLHDHAVEVSNLERMNASIDGRLKNKTEEAERLHRKIETYKALMITLTAKFDTIAVICENVIEDME